MDTHLNDLMEKVNNSNFASIRGIISRIFDILNSNKSSVNDLEQVIKLDPPLAVKVLKVANSAFYASRVEFNDLKEAVLWIGFDEIKNIAITEQLFKIFNTEKMSSFSRKDLWKNSIATALLAKMIFRREFGDKGENIYTAGLIHNIGIIIIDQFLNDQFYEILEYCEEQQVCLLESENKILGFDHTDVADKLAENWKFPAELRTIIKHHHAPEKAPESVRKKIETIFIVDYHCKKLGLGYSDHHNYDNQEKYEFCLKNNDIEQESLALMNNDLMEQIKHLESIGLLSDG